MFSSNEALKYCAHLLLFFSKATPIAIGAFEGRLVSSAGRDRFRFAELWFTELLSSE